MLCKLGKGHHTYDTPLKSCHSDIIFQFDAVTIQGRYQQRLAYAHVHSVNSKPISDHKYIIAL